LFGRFQTLSLFVFLLGVVAVLLIIFVIYRFKEQLLLGLFSRELAAATSVRLDPLNLYFLLTFSLTVLVELRFMGALLAGALVIIPQPPGVDWRANLSHFLFAWCLVSVAATSLGFLITAVAPPQFSPGPIVVIVSALLFALSLQENGLAS
jgi:ABC-type Mn2+/Zn2+ transport system permease subunit